jgi:hypothetical protein
MTAVLITGMSGVGKSTVLAELQRRGFEAVDTDDDWIEVVDGEPLWREGLMDALPSRPRRGPLIVAGTVANQGRFYRRFHAVVLGCCANTCRPPPTATLSSPSRLRS